jgi:hypothetical protein
LKRSSWEMDTKIYLKGVMIMFIPLPIENSEEPFVKKPTSMKHDLNSLLRHFSILPYDKS